MKIEIDFRNWEKRLDWFWILYGIAWLIIYGGIIHMMIKILMEG